jgi:hypothetical protein
VLAMNGPRVMSDEPVTTRNSEKTANGKDDGLKMCVERPSRVQRRNSMARNPRATIPNW